MNRIPNGVYPVMITPYTRQNTIDWEAVDAITEFYIRQGCQGVFAVCQSSEMFWLSEEERVALATRVAKTAAGRLCVVASGHVSSSLTDQIRELKRIADSGVNAAVMISNRLARPDEDDGVAIATMRAIVKAVPDIAFGMYECPYPYKRALTDRLLEAMLETGRFTFIKDTCCDAEVIAHRLKLLGGRIQLFNANAATLYETLCSGADGFSGIMANFHPELYVWLIEHFKKQPQKAQALAAALSVLSSAEGWSHPLGAKYHMNQIGVPMELISRVPDRVQLPPLHRHALDDLIVTEKLLRTWIFGETNAHDKPL